MNHWKVIGWMVGVIGALALWAAHGVVTAAPLPAPNIPPGWKVSVDATQACQVATPPDWQLGKDFFLAAEKPVALPLRGSAAVYPPYGAASWGPQDLAHLPPGTTFRIRHSIVLDDKVCSVWRTQASVDFAADEKKVMQQVSQTLETVQP